MTCDFSCFKKRFFATCMKYRGYCTKCFLYGNERVSKATTTYVLEVGHHLDDYLVLL